MKAIEFKQVKKSFKDGDSVIEALKETNFSVEKGEGIPGEVLRSCRNNLWIRASTGSASGE